MNDQNGRGDNTDHRFAAGERMEICESCGRPRPAERMSWDGRRRLWMCPECRAEEESCGCSD